jgi:hypothetical protein
MCTSSQLSFFPFFFKKSYHPLCPAGIRSHDPLTSGGASGPRTPAEQSFRFLAFLRSVEFYRIGPRIIFGRLSGKQKVVEKVQLLKLEKQPLFQSGLNKCKLQSRLKTVQKSNIFPTSSALPTYLKLLSCRNQGCQMVYFSNQKY